MPSKIFNGGTPLGCHYANLYETVHVGDLVVHSLDIFVVVGVHTILARSSLVCSLELSHGMKN
jgi:hypothetical protein